MIKFLLTYRLAYLGVLWLILLGGCATTAREGDAQPARVYIQTSDKDSYYLAFLLERQLNRRRVATTTAAAPSAPAPAPAAAQQVLTLRAPDCKRYVVFTDELGQRRDFMLQCTLSYRFAVAGEEPISAKVIAYSLLSSIDNVNLFFRREEQINSELEHDLTSQVAAAVVRLRQNLRER